jgi:hypothetical protein
VKIRRLLIPALLVLTLGCQAASTSAPNPTVPPPAAALALGQSSMDRKLGGVS